MLIDATGVELGDYTVTLESFDSLSSVKSALKTDIITVTVEEAP